MSKKTEWQIISNIIIAIFMIILTIINSSYITKEYRKKINEYHANVIGTLLSKHPELEQDIIYSYVLPDKNTSNDQIIEKYQIGFSISLKKEIQTRFLYIVLVTLLSLLIVNGYFLYRKNKQIKTISKYMNQVLSGNYSLDIKDHNEGMISTLKNDIYKMTVLLKEQSDALLEDKKYLEETLEDISHQLKTPLTSMYMINDILYSEIDKNKKNEFLDKNQKQLERIEWLITSLLKLSRLDSGVIKLKEEKVMVEQLIAKASDPIREMIKKRSIDFKIEIPNIIFYVDKNWTSEAILNIIKNACEHTKDQIIIKALENPLYVLIEIMDNGTGISKKDLPHIFERFYKGDHNKESIGIGLNMSKKIIGLQKGDIEVKTDNNGTTFAIKFYKNRK